MVANRSKLDEVVQIFKNSNLNSSNFTPIQNVPKFNAAHVSQNTQNSVDVMTDLQNYLTPVNPSFITTDDDTHIHNQKTTNLCHSYATISGLRKLLRKFLDDQLPMMSLLFLSDESSFLESAREAMNEKGDCSFNHMISVFVGCVSPRSFNDLFKDRLI